MNALHDALVFLGFFAAGLAVNLTPCVYPMLIVTVSLFKPHASHHEARRQAFAKALAYFLGIVVTYSTLGYFAASTGRLFGSILQNSWVWGVEALMMFVLALSMFGVFQLRIPPELLHRLGGLRKANYGGLFFSGMFVGLFAAPCIGPPVLALLAAVAGNGNPVFGFSAFFVFSLGLGLPYLFFGTFSDLISKLPKSGRWLIAVERFLGVALLGVSVFFLMLALHFSLPTGKLTLTWTPYSMKAVQESIDRHKPVLIDFYADWCIGCHEMDKTVFSDKKTMAKIAQVTALRVDATKIDTPEIQTTIDAYEIIGLPTVVFLDDQGKEIKEARIEGAGSIKEFGKSLDLLSQHGHVTFKE